MDFSNLNNPIPFETKCYQSTGTSQEAYAAISDVEGNLQLYITHDTQNFSGSIYKKGRIRDKTHQTILNGDSIALNPSATNGALFLPGFKKNEYYLFTLSTSADIVTPSALYYTHVKKMDTVIFNIIEKNIQIYDSKLSEKILAVKHGNGRDYWLILHEIALDNNTHTNRFVKFLFTPLGLQGPFYQNIGQLYGGG